jgi:hypothetical protein
MQLRRHIRVIAPQRRLNGGGSAGPRRFALWACALALICATTAAAAPGDDLAAAKAELSANHPYSADALLQKIVKASDASPAELQEALVLQQMVYYGDVFGAALLLAPVSAATGKPSKLGAEASKQLLMARRAFYVSAKNFLNATFSERPLKQIQLELPTLTGDDVKKFEALLNTKEAMTKLIADYDADPSAGKGLLSRTSQFGLYLGMGALLPKSSRKVEDIRASFKSGASYGYLGHLDWLATVSIELHGLAKEPQVPDPNFMLSLAKSCDERIKALTKDDPGSAYLKKAKARAGKY